LAIVQNVVEADFGSNVDLDMDGTPGETNGQSILVFFVKKYDSSSTGVSLEILGTTNY
jgi:hypothetical protein